MYIKVLIYIYMYVYEGTYIQYIYYYIRTKRRGALKQEAIGRSTLQYEVYVVK